MRRRSHAGQNLVHGTDGQIEFFIFVIEVGREANARARPPVDQDVAFDQLGRYLLRVGHLDGDGAAAARGIARRVHPPAALIGQSHQLRRLAHRLLANTLHSHLADNLQPRTRGIERRHVQRAVHDHLAAISRTATSAAAMPALCVPERRSFSTSRARITVLAG